MIAERQGGGPRRPLTERQAEVFRFICQMLREQGRSPSLREIGERTGIRSTNGVNDHLRALERKGWIERTDMVSRSCRPRGEPCAACAGLGVILPAPPSSVAPIEPSHLPFVPDLEPTKATGS